MFVGRHQRPEASAQDCCFGLYKIFFLIKISPLKKVASLHSPLLVVHGANDALIPAELGRKLYEAATTRKQFLLVEGGSHFSTMAVGQSQYREALSQLFLLK